MGRIIASFPDERVLERALERLDAEHPGVRTRVFPAPQGAARQQETSADPTATSTTATGAAPVVGQTGAGGGALRVVDQQGEMARVGAPSGSLPDLGDLGEAGEHFARAHRQGAPILSVASDDAADDEALTRLLHDAGARRVHRV